MRVLAVVHGQLVGAALFAEVIAAEGHELVEWSIGKHERPPGPVDAVLVLGGAMNVGDEEAHPWLEHEYELERGWVEAGTPLLSICLGAQTLAHAFGASVGPAPQRQAGFRELSLSAEGRNDPLLGILPPRFEALFANGYRFELPARAVSLVECRTAGSQGFRLGESAWALQFHPEVHASQVLAWWREEPELPRPFAELAAELEAGIAEWQRHGRALCRAFLAHAAAS